MLLFTFRFVKIKNVLKLSLKKQKKLRTFQPENDIFKNIQPGLEKPGSYKRKSIYARLNVKKFIHHWKGLFKLIQSSMDVFL